MASYMLITSPNKYIRSYDTNTAYFNILEVINYNQPNFKYVIRLYDYTTNTILSTVNITPDSNRYGWYNPTGYIKDYLTSDPPTIGTNTITSCPNSIKKVKLNFTQSYGIPITEYTGTTLTSTNIYYNGCQVPENYDMLYGNLWWIIQTGSTVGHFLNICDKYYLDEREKMWLYFIMGNSATFTVTYDFYDKSNNSLGSVTDSFTCTGDTMYKFGCGPANLSTGSTIAGWYYYTINFNSISEDFLGTNLPIIYNTPKCNQYDWTEVFWKNEHGGYSNFTFTKRKYIDSKIGRTTYDKLLPYGAGAGDRSMIQFNTTIDSTVTLNTDWINDEQNKLIKSLIFSPDVRILENNILVPYVLLDTDYNEMNKYDNGLYSYQIKMLKSVKKVIQRG